MISNVIKIQTVNRVYIHIDANVHCSFGSLAGIALQAWLIVYINLTRCNNFYSSLTLVQFRKLPILSHTSTTITPCDCQLSLFQKVPLANSVAVKVVVTIIWIFLVSNDGNIRARYGVAFIGYPKLVMLFPVEYLCLIYMTVSTISNMDWLYFHTKLVSVSQTCYCLRSEVWSNTDNLMLFLILCSFLLAEVSSDSCWLEDQQTEDWCTWGFLQCCHGFGCCEKSSVCCGRTAG